MQEEDGISLPGSGIVGQRASMQPQSDDVTSQRKRLSTLVEVRDVVDDFCNSLGAMADRVDRLSCDRLVHSPSTGSGFGRACDPADHRASTSCLGEGLVSAAS